ncbi:MAG: hypothetical protein GF329_13125 [Candidatus Lokiarchaeota archaeon]|nr:hypothetical protein [Candidatus Lokiarchaeota archaeon]
MRAEVRKIQIFPGHFCVSYIVYNIVLLSIGNYFVPNFLNVVIIIIAGILPDLIDSIYSTIKRISQKVKDDEFRHHAWPTHFPILYSPLIVISIIFPSVLTITIAINIYLHFIGDTLQTDDGIKWLWPFSNKYYKLFSEKMEGMHNMKWVYYYRQTFLYKIEWVLFVITSVIIIINAYILYNVILFIIALIIMPVLMICIRIIEKKMLQNIKESLITE